MLNELYSRSHNYYSVYNQDNLCTSLNLLDSWDRSTVLPTTYKELPKKRQKLDLNPEMIQFMGESTAFPYPEMLPCSALKPTSAKALESDKPFFAKAEDNLIVLGMELYFQGTDR